MKTLIGAVAAAFLMLSTAGFAADTANFKTNTTRDLVKLCSAPEDHPLHGVAMGYCLGFVQAAIDYHGIVTRIENVKPVACSGDGATRQDVVDALLAWAKTHDDLLDTEAPLHGLMRAAKAKWPCS